MTASLESFQTKIGYQFTECSRLERALTHPSCSPEHDDNQRLEFLGDAVLGLIVAEALFRNHPQLDEGALDHMRASLVNGKALTTHARTIEIDQVLRVSDAQRQHHSEPSASMLEDAFEALIGAIYLDGSIEAARTFILYIMGDSIKAAPTVGSSTNPKGRLQEWIQQHYEGAVPEYVALASQGPDHARRYSATAVINGNELGRGEGTSKKAAETAAAADALHQLKGK